MPPPPSSSSHLTLLMASSLKGLPHRSNLRLLFLASAMRNGSQHPHFLLQLFHRAGHPCVSPVTLSPSCVAECSGSVIFYTYHLQQRSWDSTQPPGHLPLSATLRYFHILSSPSAIEGMSSHSCGRPRSRGRHITPCHPRIPTKDGHPWTVPP